MSFIESDGRDERMDAWGALQEARQRKTCRERIAQLERELAEAKSEVARLMEYDRRPAQVTVTIDPEPFAFKTANNYATALESNLREYNRLIVEQRDHARQERDTLKSELTEAKALIKAWNLAAGEQFAGSEFHDDPKRVFSRVRKISDAHFDAVRKRKLAEQERDTFKRLAGELYGGICRALAESPDTQILIELATMYEAATRSNQA